MYKKIIIVLLSMLSFACSNSDENAIDPVEFLTDSTVVYKSIAGIDENLTSLDVYTLPNSKALKPVVIWVHGGGWAIGDKRNKMDKKVPFFRSLEYVFVSVNYRLSPFPYELTNTNRIKHPDHITDVADAIQWVYKNIDLYGGDKINIAVLGHSAGAHLVALMGTNQGLLSNRNINSNHIKGIGSFDTQAYDVHRAIDLLAESDLYINAFGDDETIQNDASPYYQIDNSSSITAHWLFTERGDQIRKDILNDFILKVETKNVSTTIIDANVYTHEDINNLIGDTSNTLISDAIKVFLNESFQ